VDGEGYRETARIKPRIKLFEPSEMLVGAEVARVHLLDLSTGGAQLHRRAAPPPVGAMVQLACGGTRFRLARVTWARGNRFGVAFTMPLSERQVADIRDRKRSPATAVNADAVLGEER